MKVFKYLNEKKGIAETYRIYQVIQNLKPYAISKYKVWWEDALDEAFFHVLENYDSSKGDLENYATKVVGTIYLNKNRREVASSEQTQIVLDIQEADNLVNPVEETLCGSKSDDLQDCIIDSIPYFIKDFKFFSKSSVKDKKLDYKELLNKYTYETFNDAKDYLLNKYSEKFSKILNFAKHSTLKSFDGTRYLSSPDKGLEYKGCLNDIVMVKRSKGSHTKRLYRLAIDDVIDSLMYLFYCDEEYGKLVIEGIVVYTSIAGCIIVGEDNLKEQLENEIVGSILSRTSLRVVNYIKGKEILFSSTQDHQHNVVLPMFGKDVSIGFERLVCKEVS